MHFLGIVQKNSTRRDHPGNPGGVSGSGPVTVYCDASKDGLGCVLMQSGRVVAYDS